jgi:ABC-type transporter Mla subunit MlaD
MEKRDEMREGFKEHRDEVKENISERRAQFASTTALMKTKLSERVKEFVLKRAEHLASLLDAMIERLNKLSERIQSRIDVLEGREVDTSEAVSALALAQDKIDEATTAVQTLKEAVTEALESENPREALKETKPLGETTKTAIREAHAALIEAIQALPNMQSAEEGANDTSETN